MTGKRNQLVEMRLVAEYLAANYSAFYYQTRVRLGSLPASVSTDNLDDMEAKLVHSAFARWADAVVVMPDRTLLIEAKVICHPTAIAQLMLYKRLLPFSAQLNLRREVPVIPVLLYARPDPLVIQLGIEQGIEPVQYDPPWVEDYLLTRFARQRQAPREQQMAPAP
jgi:hypothetical protein